MTLILALLTTITLLLNPIVGSTPVATPVAGYDPNSLVAIKPELREEIARALPAGMTKYEIDLTFPEDFPRSTPSKLSGRQEVTYTNTTGAPLSELPFRLYANNKSTDELTLDVHSVRVAGNDLTSELSVENTVLTVVLDKNLAPGDELVLEMDFTLALPVNETKHYGILNQSTSTDTSVLAHWYPVVAGLDPEYGWMLKPTSMYGDPIFTDAGLYEVTLTAPTDLAFITSGVETSRHENGNTATTRFNAMPSRDFAIVASTSLRPVETEVDGTTITSWALEKQQEANTSVAEWTANTLRVFNGLLGEYPWTSLQVVSAEVFEAAAVELPQMFIMGKGYYSPTPSAGWSPGFEFTTAHETVHMWFYSLVGNNQYDHAFIDESLTNYLSGYTYFKEQYDEITADRNMKIFISGPFQRMIEINADVVVDFPTDDFPSSNSYVNAAYIKGPMGFRALNQAMGDDAFFAGLRQYINDFRFRVATPRDLEAALQSHTEVDVRELWSHWFERREGGLDTRGDNRSWIT